MVLNQGECHFMCLGRNTENQTFVFKIKIMKNSEKQKIPESITDNKLNFKSQAKNSCEKASQKIWDLASLSRYLNVARKSLILKLVTRSQFSYCSIVGMFFLIADH